MTPIATADTTRDTREIPLGLVMVGEIILHFAGRIAAARARFRTTRALMTLDDHALRDIGLTRSQIDSVEHDPRYGFRHIGL